jgi:glycosyltransferase involved in cell wall biosynthesis
MRKKLFIVVNVDWFFLSHRLAVGIAAMNAGYDVTVLAADTGESMRIRNLGLSFIHVPFRRSGTNVFHELKCVNTLRNLYATLKPDIIHHVTIKVALYGSIAAKLASAGNVVNAISGLGYNFTSDRRGIMQKILMQLMRFGFRGITTRFIFQNRDDIEVFKSLKVVKDSQVSLIKGSGVNLEEFHEIPTPKATNVTVLLCARLLYDKGVVEYVNAARQLETEFSGSAQFIIAGNFDDDNLAKISREVFSGMIDGTYIKWVGFQARMVEVIGQADIVVLPSYREGLPKSLIEAAAVGRPIVTTNVPGCKECVIEGYNGYLVPAKDANALAGAIRTLILNKELRVRMGRNSRTLAIKEFSVEKVIRQTMNIYEEFLTEGETIHLES